MSRPDKMFLDAIVTSCTLSSELTSVHLIYWLPPVFGHHTVAGGQIHSSSFDDGTPIRIQCKVDGRFVLYDLINVPVCVDSLSCTSPNDIQSIFDQFVLRFQQDFAPFGVECVAIEGESSSSVSSLPFESSFAITIGLILIGRAIVLM